MIAYFAAKHQIPLIFHTFLTYNPAKIFPISVSGDAKKMTLNISRLVEMPQK